MGIAYDDFGAGQARLLELAEVPPHYLKFDMSFVRGIDTAPASRQRLLTSLVSVARDLLVYTVAEGVETAAGGRRLHANRLHPRPGLLLRPPPPDRGDLTAGRPGESFPEVTRRRPPDRVSDPAGRTYESGQGRLT